MNSPFPKICSLSVQLNVTDIGDLEPDLFLDTLDVLMDIVYCLNGLRLRLFLLLIEVIALVAVVSAVIILLPIAVLLEILLAAVVVIVITVIVVIVSILLARYFPILLGTVFLAALIVVIVAISVIPSSVVIPVTTLGIVITVIRSLVVGIFCHFSLLDQIHCFC